MASRHIHIFDDSQGCALAIPGGPWHLTFVLRQLENLSFSENSCWTPLTKPQSRSKIITNGSDFITNLPTCRHILKQGPFSWLVEITHESLTPPENYMQI